MNNFCQIHNCELEYKEWRDKNDKDRKAWKCPQSKIGSKCTIVWVDSPKEKIYSPKPTQETASQIVAMRELYLLVKAAYIILMGKQTVPPEEALKWLEDKIVELKEKK